MKIPFPIKGIDENWSYENQPPMTCRAATNVRSYDPATGRATGAQRTGLTAYIAGAVSGNDPGAAIQDINHVTQSKDDFSYADVDPPTEVWEKALAHAPFQNGWGPCAAISDDGYIYVTNEEGWVTRVNGSGAEEWSVNIVELLQEPAFGPNAIAVDDNKFDGERYLYIGTLGLSRVIPGEILKLRETTNGLELVWKITDGAEGFGDTTDIAVSSNENFAGGTVYAVQGGNTLTAITDNGETSEVRWFEPIAAGSDTFSVVNSKTFLVSGSTGLSRYNWLNGVFTQGWFLSDIGSTGVVSSVSGSTITLYSTGVAKTGNSDKVAWKHTDDTDLSGGATNRSEVWSYGTAGHYGQQPKVDTAGNLYYVDGNTTNDTREVFRLSGATPTKDWGYGTGLTGWVGEGLLLETVNASGETVPEFMYTLANDKNDPSNTTIDKARLRARSISGTTTRTPTLFAIENGQGYYDASGTWTDVGSAGDFTASLRYLQSAVFNQKIYIVDGVNHKYFDPSDKSMNSWTTTRGFLPQGVRMATVWNGRLVLYGNPDDPFNWFMSAYGDATDWDYFPVVTLATQAVAGNVSKSGKSPDLLNTIIPYSDDLAIFGCDHEIWRLTGDPMEGGRFDLISDVIGMAYGRAWCKDDRGVVYFYGSKGGVFVMEPGGIPVSLTEGRREKTLASVDLSANKIRLAWDHRARGVHVYVTPFTQAASTHYFWDKRLDAWWDMSFGTPTNGSAGDMDPTSVHVLDGDGPGDRVILLGGHDGIVRYVDYVTPAVTDAGTLIDSSVTIGPIQPAFGRGVEARLLSTDAVFNDSSGCVNYEFYDSDESLTLGVAEHNGLWKPGRNDGVRERMRGNAFWLKILDRFGAAWAFESLEMEFEQAGRVRNR